MKVALLLVVAVACIVAIDARVHHESQLAADTRAFAEFKTQFGKVYATPELESYRFTIFQSNLRLAEQRNKKGGARHGVTKFMDLAPAEFKRTYLNYKAPYGEAAVEKKSWPVMKSAKYANPPTSDWRNKNAITPVKDQGQCGSCWAFSVTETIESFWFLSGHKLTELSPQQTTDCDTGDDGCNGGDPVQAYNYLSTVGLETEASYPYTSGGSGETGTCAYQANLVVTNPITNWTYATPPCTAGGCTSQDENTLAVNVAKTGPASICVAATTWQTYMGGIVTSDCSGAYDDLDHCVQLVGLAKQNGSTYWLVRNSWNTDWGEDGYIWVQFGSNLCGVADEATFVSWN